MTMPMPEWFSGVILIWRYHLVSYGTCTWVSFQTFCILKIYNFYICFCKCIELLISSKMFSADVGPRRPHGSSPLLLRGEVGAIIPAQDLDASQDLEDIEHSLEGLTVGIPDVELEALPRPLQRQVVGVPARFHNLLRKVARAVACYREHRP